MVELAMPLAVPPPGTDPAAFYATFAGKLSASWNPGEAVIVWLDADPSIARLHAPIKAAMSFVPAGGNLDGAPAPSNTLRLATWPVTFLEAKAALPAPVPAEIRFTNVDDVAVRAAVTAIYAGMGRPATAADSFMQGEGLVRVAAGAEVGGAAAGVGPPIPATPNMVGIDVRGSDGNSANPLQFLADAADHAGIDKAVHPLLAALPLEGWVDVLVEDEAGAPIAGEDYVLYLSDGTQRNGTTDPHGRIFEAGLPAGPWQLNIPSRPSLELVED